MSAWPAASPSPSGWTPQLAPPPRRVPASLRARLLFGGFGFALETETGRREIAMRTHRAGDLEEGARERILYDPVRPDDAILWRALPSAPSLDRAGQRPAAGRASDGAGTGSAAPFRS